MHFTSDTLGPITPVDEGRAFTTVKRKKSVTFSEEVSVLQNGGNEDQIGAAEDTDQTEQLTSVAEASESDEQKSDPVEEQEVMNEEGETFPPTATELEDENSSIKNDGIQAIDSSNNVDEGTEDSDEHNKLGDEVDQKVEMDSEKQIAKESTTDEEKDKPAEVQDELQDAATPGDVADVDSQVKEKKKKKKKDAEEKPKKKKKKGEEGEKKKKKETSDIIE